MIITSNYIDRDSDEETFSGESGKHQRLKKLKVEGKDEGEAPAPSSPQGEGFKIKKKKKAEEAPSDHKKQENSEKNLAKAVKYNLEKLNLNKVFEEIIDAAYKDKSLMTIMKNILSNGKRYLNDRKAQIKKRWYVLKNSNLAEQEYRKQQKALEKSELDEIRELKEDIYNKLCASKIRGFDTKETILDNFKKSMSKTHETLGITNVDEGHVNEILEKEFQDYKNDILELLDKLLNERIFTEDADIAGRYPMDMKDSRARLAELKGEKRGESMESQRPYEKNMRENKAPKSQRRKVTCQVGKEFIENEVRLNEYLANYETRSFFNLQEKDRLLLKKSEVPVINNSTVERSNDELFLQEQFEKNGFLLQDLEKKAYDYNGKPDYDILKDLVYLTNFVMYNLHSYQKYNIERSMINPNDLLYLLNKFS